MICDELQCSSKEVDYEDNYCSICLVEIVEQEQCSFQSRKMVAKELSQNVFREGCKPKDSKCEMANSIIVWDKSVVSSCMFVSVGSGYFVRVTGNIIQAHEKHVAFELIKKVKNCGYDMYETTEHLWVGKLTGSAGNDYAITKCLDNPAMINSKLIEAEEDFEQVDKTMFHREINKRHCLDFHNL